MTTLDIKAAVKALQWASGESKRNFTGADNTQGWLLQAILFDTLAACLEQGMEGWGQYWPSGGLGKVCLGQYPGDARPILVIPLTVPEKP